MKKIFTITSISLSLALVNCSFLIRDTKAQIEVKPNVEIKTPTLNDLGIPNSQEGDTETEGDSNNIQNLPNNSQQMFSWRCTQGNQTIAVEVKDVDNWQKALKTDAWDCQEDVSMIPGNKGKFSCTPKEDIGILTVVWLQGDKGKQQMQTWFDNLNKNNMVCYQSKTNKFWS